MKIFELCVRKKIHTSIAAQAQITIPVREVRRARREHFAFINPTAILDASWSAEGKCGEDVAGTTRAAVQLWFLL
jgi:hypothetical protein